MMSARPVFELVWKSLRVSMDDDELPSTAPTEVIDFRELRHARRMAAEILVGGRTRHYKVFSMDVDGADPYRWCMINGEHVHFISIRAQEPST
jgi:hypothetical protein